MKKQMEDYYLTQDAHEAPSATIYSYQRRMMSVPDEVQREIEYLFQKPISQITT